MQQAYKSYLSRCSHLSLPPPNPLSFDDWLAANKIVEPMSDAPPEWDGSKSTRHGHQHAHAPRNADFRRRVTRLAQKNGWTAEQVLAELNRPAPKGTRKTRKNTASTTYSLQEVQDALAESASLAEQMGLPHDTPIVDYDPHADPTNVSRTERKRRERDRKFKRNRALETSVTDGGRAEGMPPIPSEEVDEG